VSVALVALAPHSTRLPTLAAVAVLVTHKPLAVLVVVELVVTPLLLELMEQTTGVVAAVAVVTLAAVPAMAGPA
jgi:hypothetical protein